MDHRPPLDALIHQLGCEPARSNFRDIIDDVQPPARRLNNEHLKAKAAHVLTMQSSENRRFPGRISDATSHIRCNRPRVNAPQANRCFSRSGRHVEEQLGGERARPGERRRRLRGAYGRDGRRLRDRGLRVRVEEPEGRN